MKRTTKKILMLTTIIVLLFSQMAFANISQENARVGNVYEVGPGKKFENICDAPWGSLKAGDTVKIHWREAPYKEKFLIRGTGTADAPITISGIAGPNGQLPIVDGDGAVDNSGVSYSQGERSLIKIGGGWIDDEFEPAYIIIENLDLRGARYGTTFSDSRGSNKAYNKNAAGVNIEKGENITIRNCVIHDNGNGIMANGAKSINILVEGNYIYGHGYDDGRGQEHNVYTTAKGIIYQYNRFGPLAEGSAGHGLKDRSSGTIIRYNYIEGGNRQLDLVDTGAQGIVDDPEYKKTYVYGNILIEPKTEHNRQIVHFGGEGDPSQHRGTLYFYNNTVVSNRTDRTTLFRISSDACTIDARNNIFYVSSPGDTLEVKTGDGGGILNLSHNWFKTGWVYNFGGSASGIINDDGTYIEEEEVTKFVDEAQRDYRLLPGSACVDAGIPLHPNVLPEHDVLLQYSAHQAAENRPISKERPRDKAIDIGAFELPSGRDLGMYLKSINKK